MLRMDRELNKKQRLQRVDDVLKELGLTECAKSRIGDPATGKGISGGQSRRLSFASEVCQLGVYNFHTIFICLVISWFNPGVQHFFSYLQLGNLPNHRFGEISIVVSHSPLEIAIFPTYRAMVSTGAQTRDLPFFGGHGILSQRLEPCYNGGSVNFIL